MPSVVVVGSVNADLVVSVARLPQAGETVTGGTFARHGGGKGANQAVAAARAGASVAMVGAVGADDLGDEALRELAAEGIDVAAVVRLDGVPTGVAAIVVDEQGENFVAVASGANAELDAATVERGGAAGRRRRAAQPRDPGARPWSPASARPAPRAGAWCSTRRPRAGWPTTSRASSSPRTPTRRGR